MEAKKKASPEEKLLGLYQSVFNGPSGKIVLHDMMINSGMFRSSYVKGDAHGTSYAEGRRSIVLDIISILKRDENQDFLQQVSDNQEDFNNEFSN